MSEQQKIFASLSGAFIAHLLLLFLVFPLLNTRAASSSLRGESRFEQGPPKEVAILMSDLMEHITTEAPEPEARPFISADLNRPENEAPADARFESDRNTTAASELPQDENLPGERVPTLNGDSPLPHLTLQNREHIEGSLEEVPSVVAVGGDGIAGGQSALIANSRRAPRNATDFPPDVPDQKTDEREYQEGAKDLPKERLDVQKFRREGPNESAAEPDERAEEPGTDADSSLQRSFVAPSVDPEAPVLGAMSVERDRIAARKGHDFGEEEESTDRDQEMKDAAPLSKSDDDSGLPSTIEKETMNTADEGLFSSGFSPEERQNVISGSLARVGQNSVDAEETALGRYKKAVRDAISSTWHLYRQKNGDFVTWGILKLEFTLDKKGQVKNLHITKNEANAILAEFSLKAIREAKLPPMPDEVARSIGSEGLVIQYDIIIY